MEKTALRLFATSALLGAGLLMTGCGPVNRGLESVNQPVVSRTDYTLDVSADGLQAGTETPRLTAWLDAMRLGYGDGVAVDDPSPYGAAASREALGGIIARYGLLVAPAAPVTTGQIAPGMVRIVVSRSRADVPGCPNWDRPSQPEFEGSTTSNYGCAGNGNLALMVADPQDLLRGREDGTIDPRTATKAITSYRTGAPTGANSTIKSETTGGK